MQHATVAAHESLFRVRKRTASPHASNVGIRIPCRAATLLIRSFRLRRGCFFRVRARQLVDARQLYNRCALGKLHDEQLKSNSTAHSNVLSENESCSMLPGSRHCVSARLFPGQLPLGSNVPVKSSSFREPMKGRTRADDVCRQPCLQRSKLRGRCSMAADTCHMDVIHTRARCATAPLMCLYKTNASSCAR